MLGPTRTGHSCNMSVKSADQKLTMADQADMSLSLWSQLGVKQAHVVSQDMGDSILTEILARRDRGQLPGYFGKDFFKVIGLMLFYILS